MDANKLSKTKVGRYPLQKLQEEIMPGSYISRDYLYEHPAGYVWMRLVHNTSPGVHQGERTLSVEFIHKGIKYRQWLPPLGVNYGERRLRKVAKDFADENSQ
jgi:hypothetical protein